MSFKLPNNADVWSICYYEHCGKKWDIYRKEVTHDECPVCGMPVDPTEYEEDDIWSNHESIDGYDDNWFDDDIGYLAAMRRTMRS